MTFTLCESLLFLEERKEIMIIVTEEDTYLLEKNNQKDFHRFRFSVYNNRFREHNNIANLIYLENRNIISCLLKDREIVSKDFFPITNLNQWSKEDDEKLKTFIEGRNQYLCEYEEDFKNKLENEIIRSIIENTSFKEIGDSYYEIMHYYTNNNYYIPGMLFFANLDYLSICERLLKSGINIEGLIKTMPTYSNNWDFKKRLGGIISKYIECYPNINVCVLNELYALKNCGPDGLSTIFDFMNSIYRISESLGFINTMLEDILYILKEIPNLKTKILIDIIIRNALKQGKCLYLLNGISSIMDFPREMRDVISMAKQLNIDITTELIKNCHLYHDDLAQQIKTTEDRMKSEEFERVCKENAKLLHYVPESNEYTIICPTQINDLSQEGHNMHNCVAGYLHRIIEGTSKIYFMRRKGNINTSFITVELNSHNEPIQYFRKCNKHVSDEEKNFIQQWGNNMKGANINEFI